MAKDKVTLETISGQLSGVSSELSNQWNALNTLAGRLGISLTDTGEYFMESDNTDIPQLSQQSLGCDVPSQPPAPAMDVTTIAKEVVAEFKKNPPSVDLGKQSVSLDIMSIVKANKGLFDVVTKPWSDWFINHRKSMLKLHGYKEVTVGDDTILAVDDSPAIPPNPLKDDSVREPTEKPKPRVKRSKLGSLLHRIWLDIVSCFWKTFAYYIASLAVLFGTCLWWEQKQRAEELNKRVLIYRYALEADSGGYEFLHVNDRNIEEYGLDYVLDYYKKRVQEVRRKRLLNKRR